MYSERLSEACSMLSYQTNHSFVFTCLAYLKICTKMTTRNVISIDLSKDPVRN